MVADLVAERTRGGGSCGGAVLQSWSLRRSGRWRKLMRGGGAGEDQAGTTDPGWGRSGTASRLPGTAASRVGREVGWRHPRRETVTRLGTCPSRGNRKGANQYAHKEWKVGNFGDHNRWKQVSRCYEIFIGEKLLLQETLGHCRTLWLAFHFLESKSSSKSLTNGTLTRRLL